MINSLHDLLLCKHLMFVHVYKFSDQLLKVFSVSFFKKILRHNVVKELIQKLGDAFVFKGLVMKPFVNFGFLFSRKELFISDLNFLVFPIQWERTSFGKIVIKVKMSDLWDSLLDHWDEIYFDRFSNPIKAFFINLMFHSKYVLKNLFGPFFVCLVFPIFHQFILLKERVFPIKLSTVENSCSWNLIIPVALSCVIQVRIICVFNVVFVAFRKFPFTLLFFLWSICF